MRRLRLILALTITWPVTAAAQETTGGVRGRLHSPATGPVANAQITATSPDLLGERRALSAGDGVFQFSLLAPGTYTLRVTAIGHRPLVIRDVAVQLGRITGLGDVALEPAAVELGELTVEAPALTLDPVRTTVGATLTAEDFALLPAQRDYKSAIAILPHVNTSPHGDPVNVAGSTGLENMYFIDGMNVTAPLDATRGTSLPYNFVRAVEVKAGGYEAQYGKALGAVVNAITYSGTNAFESEVFGFVTHDALAADPKGTTALREVGSMGYDVGARISGPVVRDRLWFSAAYNPRVDRIDKEIPGLGVYRDETTAQMFAGKLTWRAAPRTDIVLSLFGDPTTQHQVTPLAWAPHLTAVNADPFLWRHESGGVTGTLRATAVLGSRLLLEAASGYSQADATSLGETDIGRNQQQYRDLVEGRVEGGISFQQQIAQGRANALVQVTASLGPHSVVGGLEYEDEWVSQSGTISGGAWIDRTDSATWVVTTGVDTAASPLTHSFHNRIPTAYVQDSWRLTDRLALNVGLRWSTQTLTGASGNTAQEFPHEWQPRIGVSWQLGRHATQRVFGSYGRFYQQTPLLNSTIWYAGYSEVALSYSTDPRQSGAVPDRADTTLLSEYDAPRLIEGIEVENFDEFTLGYERLLGSAQRLTVRAIRRDLRSSYQWGVDQDNVIGGVIGTPGKGEFAFLPPPRREYAAVELALDGRWRGVQYRTSYVLSRTYGNYSGLYMSDYDIAFPGGNYTFMAPWQAVNSTGLLPNDRTHVFKLTGAARPLKALAIGAFVTVASGIPMNDFGAGSERFGGTIPVFLQQRGTVGRTPAAWDINVRLGYDLSWRNSLRGRVLLDLLHLGNPREVVQVDEQHYFSLDNGVQSSPNPNYLGPSAYQPPMAARLGIEMRL